MAKKMSGGALGRDSVSFEDVARRLRPGDVAQEKATARVNFLVTPAEKAAIQAAASSFGLTVTDYFLRLHRLTLSMMTARGRRKIN